MINLPDSAIYKNLTGDGLIPRIITALGEIQDLSEEGLFKTNEVLNMTIPNKILASETPAAFVNLGTPIQGLGASKSGSSHPDSLLYSVNTEILIVLNIATEVATETDIRREQAKVQTAVELALRRPTDDMPTGIEPLTTATEPLSELYWQVNIDAGIVWMRTEFIESFKRLGTEIKFEPPYYAMLMTCQWLVNNRMTRQ